MIKCNILRFKKNIYIKKGIYYIFLEKLSELLENVNNYNGHIYELIELKLNNWIFVFESINDIYHWLSKKNKMLPYNFYIASN